MKNKQIIQQLDQQVINQIAAGEVIEAPSSAVKELVENAIDAKATEIRVEISKGGKRLIKVSDNGTGINEEDLETAFLPHTTSKLRKLEDLEHIESLGFRGEALASISSVSKVEVYTKTVDATHGTYAVFENSKIQYRKPVGCPEGTSILIHDLFSNTPARLKYLKNDGAESSRITELMTRIALSKTDIAFQYVNNNNIMLTTLGDNSIFTAMESIFPRELALAMIKGVVDPSNDNEIISISGLIGQPSCTRGNRSYQIFFVNNRLVRSSFLSNVFEEAYGEALMTRRHPIGILYLFLPPSLVDVNVHPSKTTVKFIDEALVQEALKKFVTYNLREFSLLATSDPMKHTLSPNSVNTPTSRINITSKSQQSLYTKTPQEKEIISKKLHETGIEKNKQNITRLKYDIKNKEKPVTVQENIYTFQEPSNHQEFGIEVAERENSHKQSDFLQQVIKNKTYRFAGHIFNTYLLLESGECLYYIDQHAAHERVVYESMMKSYRQETVSVQQLMEGQILELSAEEAEIVTIYEDVFLKIGLEIQKYGTRSYRLMGVPYEMGTPVGKEWILDLIDDLKESHTSKHLVPTDKIIRAACRYSIMARDALASSEISSLIEQIGDLSPPLTCPHGRPIVVQQRMYDIEKMFKRV